MFGPGGPSLSEPASAGSPTGSGGPARAQSETIGVLLLTGVVIIVIGIGAVVVLGGQASGQTPVVDFEPTVTSGTVTLRQTRGDTITKDELAVVVQGADQERYGMETFTELDGNSDLNLDPGERVRHPYTIRRATARVLVVHEPTGTTLYNRVVDVSSSAIVADFGWSPKPPKTGETVTLDGSGSVSGTPIASYEWDFGADGSYEQTGQTVTTTYSDDGTYDVRLRVTNNSGASGTITKTLTVENRAPSPSITVATDAPTTADAVTFDATGSTDPDGSPSSYEWDLDGDGTYEKNGATVSRGYSPAGDYDVALRVTDDDGGQATATRTVTIDQAALLVAVEPDPERLADNDGEFVAVEFQSAVNTTDWVVTDDESGAGNARVDLPDGKQSGGLYVATNATAFERTWAVDDPVLEFDGGNLANSGDVVRLVNTSSGTTVDAFGYEGVTTAGGWSFDFSGTTGDVAVRESSGGSFTDTDRASDWREIAEEAYLNDRPSATFAVAPSFPNPGERVEFDASASADSDGIASYQWNFDDGTTTTTSEATTNHTFGARGNYTVELTVTDTESGTNTTTTNVTVGRAPDPARDRSDGLVAEYYEADGPYTSMPAFDTEVPDRLSRVDAFDISNAREEDFAFRFTGHVRVPRNGTYRFYTDSDDGSALYIGDERVVENYGLHSAEEQSGTIRLEAGYHNLTVTYFEHTIDDSLDVRWSGPGIAKESIPQAYLTTGPAAIYDAQCQARDCAFEASESVAGGRGIDTYEWDFGDGTTTTTSGPTTSYSYGSDGEYDTSLTIVEDGEELDTSELRAETDTLRPADDPGPLVPGLGYEYYEQRYTEFPDYESTDATAVGTTDDVTLSVAERGEEYATRYRGYIDVPESGEYTFETTSDDGSRLYIGDQLVVGNGGQHEAETVTSDPIALAEGNHSLTVEYFDQGGETELTARWSGPDFGMREIEPGVLYRQTPIWEMAADWDAAISERGVVHEDFGDRRADVVELGYPSEDRNGDALLGYWPLDEDGGTATVDVSGNGYDGTRTNGLPSQAGAFGTTAYDFQDSGWVELPGFPNQQSSFTVSAWIRTRDASERGQRIFVDDANNVGGYGFSLGDPGAGQLRFYSRDVGPVSLDTGAVVQSDRWYHVVAVADTDASARRIYVDGVEEASGTYSGSWGTDPGAAAIGGETDNGETENRFDGQVDEVRVYDRVLSASEIQRLSDTGTAGRLSTDARSLSTAVDGNAVRLRNVQASVPGSTGIAVTVESDPDGDGTFEETSDQVDLTGGTSSYEVTGLSSSTRTVRLVIDYSSSSPTGTPTLDRIAVGS